MASGVRSSCAALAVKRSCRLLTAASSAEIASALRRKASIASVAGAGNSERHTSTRMAAIASKMVTTNTA